MPDDFYSEAYFRDPHPFWARLRADQPIFHDTVWDSWILSRYADVEAVFKDHERYSNATYSSNTGEVFGRTLLEMDGLDHVVRRSIVAPEFVGRRLQGVRRRDRPQRGELIEPWCADGQVDLVDAFTTRLPINVIVDMLALPKSDHHRFHDWYTAMMNGLGRTGQRAAGRAAHAEVCAYVPPSPCRSAEPARAPTCCPRSFMGGRRSVPHDGRDRELWSLMLVAGGETTDKAIANLWWNLLSHSDTLAAVAAEPNRLDDAFSESMRKDGPVQFEDRFTTTEVEWYGTTVPAGARVRCAWRRPIATNPCSPTPAASISIGPTCGCNLEHRSGTHSADGRTGHLGFGIGKHFCLGYELARTESVIGSRRLLEVMGEPRTAQLDVADVPRRVPRRPRPCPSCSCRATTLRPLLSLGGAQLEAVTTGPV